MGGRRAESQDGIRSIIDRLAEILPHVVIETRGEDGLPRRAVDFDLLRRALADDARGGDAPESGRLDGTSRAGGSIRPGEAFLRPCPEAGRFARGTRNLCIEGDNLDVLGLLQETHAGAVKLVYADPPYNTGNAFVYRDRLPRRRGRAADPHAAWLEMMRPRLLLARGLLRDDGAVFISIDDHEAAELRRLCADIFGERNFIAQLCWKRRGGRQDSRHFAVNHEYVLCFARNIDSFVAGRAPAVGGRRGGLRLLRKWGANSRREDRPNLHYAITDPDGGEHWPVLPDGSPGCWRWSRETMAAALAEGRVEFRRRKGAWTAYERVPDGGPEGRTRRFPTWLEGVGGGAESLRELFGGAVFDYPKSPELMCLLLDMANVGGDDVVLDIFAGSATTAHAVMLRNARDGGRRRFVMIQRPDPCPPGSRAAAAGFADICGIGWERIRRAGDRILAEWKARRRAGEDIRRPDTGFRVLAVERDAGRNAGGAEGGGAGDTAEGGRNA